MDNRNLQANSNYLDNQYVVDPRSFSQPFYPYRPFDGFSNFQQNHHFIADQQPTLNACIENNELSSAMPSQQGNTFWIPPASNTIYSTHQPGPPQYLQNNAYQYSLNPSNTADVQNQSSAVKAEPGTPSTPEFAYTHLGFKDYDTDNLGYDASFQSAEFLYTANCQDNSNKHSDSFLHDAHDHSEDFARLSISRSPGMDDRHDSLSPKATTNSLLYRSSTSPIKDEDDDSTRETTMAPDNQICDDPNAEVPYAKLIYNALMSKEDHAMVLQEIYAWFRQNTNKDNSDSKGWMNSIRHNLSMNAAFEKTERKMAGDDSKKSTEWVLADFAVQDGVQSTTRYRSKGHVMKRLCKPEHPNSNRQISGRKGGLSGGKIRSHRTRIREEQCDMQRKPLDHNETYVHPIQRQISPHEYNYLSSPSPPHRGQHSPPRPYYFHSLAQGPFEPPYHGLQAVTDTHWVSGGPFFKDTDFSNLGDYPGM